MRGRLQADLAERRAARERAGRQRSRRALRVDGPCHQADAKGRWVDFCSNDYLGLAREPSLLEAARQSCGAGAGASPLVSGHSAAHAGLEEALADWLGAEAAVLLPSGYQANLALGPVLLGRGEVALADRLNHASLNDGLRLSGARIRRYAHADAADAERRCDDRVRWLVTDSVFSMDGDVAPLGALAGLADRRGLGLWVDDAHGLGVLGPGGRGALAAFGVAPDARVVTFGKALGTQGAAILGDAALIDELVNAARGVIYSTALAPMLVAATRHALDRLRDEAWRRERLHAHIARFQAGLARAGLPRPDSRTPIQPIVLGDDVRAVAASEALEARGYLVRAIRPPTVPEGTARLRVTLSAAHAEAEIDGLVEALGDVLARAVA
ncbi:8-amino-7-oxononanoate synthase [Wenzhouxiangella sp. XN79A]|uniref:aminotransferase class I/II-fold pyridoxal phosphate-dependent enzyme n=1 Tax=Wenzhouxiangella sp. XN79A TaxID=2724193 RepID=UPI00144AE5B3|nr:8-amino-7-oxononanoate synthase [Wenzhouxiangella sp. XN79A]NKI35269.1 8-amino-7-oxononanoate synthase [Wenzhouxiangella sp. XN79A]